MKRRKFIFSSAIIGSLLPFSNILSQKRRKFKISLNPGSIGVSLKLNELADIAKKYGYEAISPNILELKDFTDYEAEKFKEKMDTYNLSWDSAGLPVDFRNDNSIFRDHLSNLKNYCQTMKKFKVDKLNTWVMPTHKELTYKKNFSLHKNRISMISEVIQEFDIKLGLEYVGVRTLMNRDKYPFIHTIDEIRDLIEDIDSKNIKYQLDSFHWYCSEDSIEKYSFLTNEDIVTVDLNDAVIGRDTKSQIDYERELPSKTGLIDIKKFINFLVDIDYNGSVRAEPFNKVLSSMDDENAIKKTFYHINQSIKI